MTELDVTRHQGHNKSNNRSWRHSAAEHTRSQKTHTQKKKNKGECTRKRMKSRSKWLLLVRVKSPGLWWWRRRWQSHSRSSRRRDPTPAAAAAPGQPSFSGTAGSRVGRRRSQPLLDRELPVQCFKIKHGWLVREVNWNIEKETVQCSSIFI